MLNRPHQLLGRALVAGLLTISLLITVNGADARVSVLSIDDHERFAHLAITGDITKADADTFARVVGTMRPKFEVIDVELNSLGGDVLAAIAIGNIIRSQSIWTVASADKDAECASACVLVLAAGVVRISKHYCQAIYSSGGSWRIE